MFLNKTRLLTPGPTPLPESVRLALARDMIHHRKEDFEQIMLAVQDKLRRLFGTAQPVLPLACSGTGAMTAAVYSLFRPGEKVLVVEAGKFGERWREIALSRGLAVESIDVEWGGAIRPAELKARLAADSSISGVLIQLCETSTGVLQPVAELAPLVGDALLVVDGISAVGISPCPMDKLGIDCLLTGSQKGLMLPPGLALLALSSRAWSRAESIEPGCFYFNLPGEKRSLEKGQTSFTTPVNLVFGLNASLDLLFEAGLPNVYAKQWALTMLARRGLKSLGLELVAKENFAWGVTSAWLPEGIPGGEVLAIAAKKYGVQMAGGQDRLKGRIIRMGHMGWVDWADCLAGLCALSGAMNEVSGYGTAVDYMGEAMEAYQSALASFPQQPLNE